MKQDEFDFGTDPAPVEAADACTHGETHASVVEGELTSRRVTPAMAASAGSVVELKCEPQWQEVPAARFLSWSTVEQLAYCVARDEDSASSAVGRGEDPKWYHERARAWLSR